MNLEELLVKMSGIEDVLVRENSHECHEESLINLSEAYRLISQLINELHDYKNNGGVL